MTELKTIFKNIERKTYLKGRLRGKYFGFLDTGLSDLVHENFYSIEILEAEIQVTSIKRWNEGGEFNDFTFEQEFTTKLPKNTIFHIHSSDGILKSYSLDIKTPKLKNIILYNEINEGNKRFGTIEGDFCGYVLKIEQKKELEVIDYEENIDLDLERDDRKESDQENINSKQTDKVSFWKTAGLILQSILSILFVLPLIYAGWPFLLIIGAFMLLQFIGQLVQPVFKYIGKPFISFIWILFLSIVFFSLISYLSKNTKMAVSTPVSRDLPVEKTKLEEIEGSEIGNTGTKDSIISHYRVWKDYSSVQYQGFLKLRYSDWLTSTTYHQNITVSGSGIDGYNQLLQQFLSQDSSKMSGVYALFDTLRFAYHLEDKAFAEVIVSCVQDIPYTLILDNACDPSLYNDQFINQYLTDGGICHPFVKFGIFSPVEFAATLHGDCDTRSLLLFIILKHYGYDVVMLSSDVYKHSVIAINMPYLGISKIINGKRYVIWETTQAGIPAGVFPSQMSNMNLWFINLTTINSTAQ